MEWNEKNKARIYAALHGKLERIRNEVLKQMSSHKRGSEGFFLSQDKYNDFLDSCGILRVIRKKSRKIPPHWITESKNPAETENSIIIPNPTFDRYGSASPANNSEKDLGLCIPEEVALKILTLGIP
jgi:hypothetical protein